MTIVFRSFQYYARCGELWRKEEKYNFLDEHSDLSALEWQKIESNKYHAWLNKGMREEFEDFVLLGSKYIKLKKIGAENSIFSTYSTGVYTGRDAWVYGFDKSEIINRIEKFISFYTYQLLEWLNDSQNDEKDVNDFVEYDDKKIKWSRNLHRAFKQEKQLKLDSKLKST
jgi:predicted helicase